MDERSKRIVNTAIELAESGGYDAVRLRDVATHANVALGTVYKRFKSKEDILLAALEREASAFTDVFNSTQLPGDTAEERVVSFFAMATRMLCMRAKFARAVLKAMASGDPELTQKISKFQATISNLLHGAMNLDRELTAADYQLSELLQSIWFAAMVGWMGELHDADAVIDQIRFAAHRLLHEAS